MSARSTSPLTARRRTVTLLGGGALGGLGLAGCQLGATMFGGCTPSPSAFGTDDAYVLHCVNGEWEPVMTVGEFVRASQGDSVTISSLPSRPTTSTTAPASTTNASTTTDAPASTTTQVVVTTSTSTSTTTIFIPPTFVPPTFNPTTVPTTFYIPPVNPDL